MEENLPADAEPSEWTWLALVNWANTRFELNLKEKDLSKFARQNGDEFEFGRADLEEFLHEKAAASIEKFDLAPAQRVPRARLGTAVAGRLGPSQVRAGDRSRVVGRARPRRGDPPAPGRGAAALRAQGGRAARSGSR